MASDYVVIEINCFCESVNLLRFAVPACACYTARMHDIVFYPVMAIVVTLLVAAALLFPKGTGTDAPQRPYALVAMVTR